jgi:CRP-like cAMP-binding protein
MEQFSARQSGEFMHVRHTVITTLSLKKETLSADGCWLAQITATTAMATTSPATITAVAITTSTELAYLLLLLLLLVLLQLPLLLQLLSLMQHGTLQALCYYK